MRARVAAASRTCGALGLRGKSRYFFAPLPIDDDDFASEAGSFFGLSFFGFLASLVERIWPLAMVSSICFLLRKGCGILWRFATGRKDVSASLRKGLWVFLLDRML